MFNHSGKKQSIYFKVRVQPRASKNEVAGFQGDAVKIRLTAPPVDGEANEACRGFLADLLDVPRSQVELVAGHTCRNKVIKISGIKAETVLRKLGMDRCLATITE